MRTVFTVCVLAVLAACALIDENGRPCPCSEGWTCCEANEQCVADASACPAVVDIPCDPVGTDCTGFEQSCYPLADGGGICTSVGMNRTGQGCAAVASRRPDCVVNNVCLLVTDRKIDDVIYTGRVCVPFCNVDGGVLRCTTGLCQPVNGVTWGTCN